MSIPKRKLLLITAIVALAIDHPALRASPIAEIPFELIGEHICIAVRVNDSPELSFLFDTGCTEVVIDSNTAEDLKLFSGYQTRDYGKGSLVERVIPNARMAMGQLQLENIKLKKQSLKYLKLSKGRHPDGVIGNDILQNYIVEIDYDKMTFEIYDQDGYVYDGSGRPYRINTNPFYSTINAAIALENGQVLEGRFLIDTGAEITVALATPFVNENDLLSKTGKRLECSLHSRNATMTSYQARVASFNLGDSDFARIPVFLSQTESGPLLASALAGIIGNEVLKRFNAVYDYRAKTIYLEPNHLHEAPFKVNSSGLEVRLTSGNKILIDRVYPDSPASEAGLVVGDEITEINGNGAEKPSIHEVRNLLSRAGEKIHLLVRHGNVKKKISLTLKELI